MSTHSANTQTVNASTQRVVFSSDRQLFTTTSPIQVGKARRSEPITLPGLYNISKSIDDLLENDPLMKTKIHSQTGEVVTLYNNSKTFSVYNFGQKLPLFKLGNSWYTYVRNINDFYTNRNFLWAGDLTITNNANIGTVEVGTKENDWLQHDGINALIDAQGKMTKIFRKSVDINFSTFISSRISSTITPYGPAWSFGQITAAYTSKIAIDYPKVDTSRKAKVIFGIYDDGNFKLENRIIELQVNNGEKIVCNYNSIGEHLFTAEFDSSVLDGKAYAEVKITPMGKISKVTLDICEVYIPVRKDSNGGYELSFYYSPNMTSSYSKIIPNQKYPSNLPQYLCVKVDDNYNGKIKINKATVAIGLGSKQGEESLININNGEITSKDGNRFIYFTSGPLRGSISPLDFEAEKDLGSIYNQINSKAFDYVAIIPEDNNYFLQLRDYHLTDERNISSFVKAPWQKDSSFEMSNLYKTWISTTHNGKTIEQLHKQSGLTPLYLKLEDVIDIYGSGIYGPYGIINFLSQNPQLKNVCLVSGTTPDYRKLDYNDDPIPYYVQTPGVPTGFFYGSQCGLTSSDDIYTDWRQQSRIVGRIPVFTDSDLTAWIKKRISYNPSDTFSLWTGINKDASFTEKQLQNHGKLPTMIFDDINENSSQPSSGSDSMSRKIFESFKAGTTIGIYQGHGATEYLDENSVLHSIKDEIVDSNNKNEMTTPGCFVWATCDAGRFFANSYTNQKNKNGFYAPLAYHYIAGKKADEEYLNNITSPGDHTKGAVNIIAASSLAAANWEARFVGKIVEKIGSDEDVTWGEVYQYAKKYTTYDQNSKVYHFLGDPSLKVRGNNPRSAKLGSNSSYKNTIPLTLKGDWINKQPLLNNLKIRYDGALSGELTNVLVSSLTDDQKNALLTGGTTVNLDISSIPELTNITFNVYTEHSPDNFEILWSKNKIDIDRSGPTGLNILRPAREEALGNNGNGIIDSQFLCKGSTDGDERSPIAGYQFILTDSASGKSYQSNPLNNLLQTPEFVFKASMITGGRPSGSYELKFIAYDILGNASETTKTIYWRKQSNFYIDSDGDSLSDIWEELYFGNKDYSDGSQDSDGDGITDYDEYLNGTQPYEFYFNLKIGWNMLSLPSEIDDKKLGEIISAIDSFWIFDGSSQKYDTVDKAVVNSIWDESGNIINNYNLSVLKSKLQPLTGFWAFCINEPAEPINYTGTHSKDTVNVKPGWNLVGPAAKHTYSSKTTMENANEWSHDIQKYAPLKNGEFLLPATGYWIFNSTSKNEDLILK